jgi:hypothetical protein
VTAGLRGAKVRVESRLDGSLAVRYGDRYLPTEECIEAVKPKKSQSPKNPGARGGPKQKSEWNKNFDLKKGPKVWRAAQLSGSRPKEAIG